VRRRALLLLALAAGCAPAPRRLTPGAAHGDAAHGDAAHGDAALVDPRATAETRALFASLRRLAGRQVMFGHQETLAYGYTWTGERDRSDVKDASGSFPAVYGWDLGPLFPRRPPPPGTPSRADRLRAWIAEGYGRGGVITMSWHMGNPVSGGDAWDTTVAVPHLLPGGARHAAYRATLDTVADFFRSLRARGRDGRETLVPVVFRPYHETTGGWFWWGRRHATPAEYAALWRFTVRYLRDERQVHNLLWSYSTDAFDSKADYLDRWPGDAWVDVLGFDDYGSVRTPATRATLVRRLRDVVELADARGKVAALTETGVEAVPDPRWWTGTLLPALDADAVTRRIAWVLAWRNANPANDRKDHFFAPYAGHASAADFRRFRDHPLIAFEDELPDMYRPAAAR
jgi:mannan endo-1,4-beta-mannosidase